MSLMCDVCKEVAVRYKCPRCLKKTCCLACVKQHKTADGCSGVRDKTAYVAMKQFSEMHLLNGTFIRIFSSGLSFKILSHKKNICKKKCQARQTFMMCFASKMTLTYGIQLLM